MTPDILRRARDHADMEVALADARGQLRRADGIINVLVRERDEAIERARDSERALHVALGLPAVPVRV